ncbi:MAG: sigma-70 family RNA polymerase sigma factor [Candidatus Eisenbacteria bacterium]|nr:sigma-70 family RNA polymerase sigma factor [Candidatus Eisenbacteria bacterium]
MKVREATELGDEELVRIAQASPNMPAGRKALAQLLHRYQDRLYSWCYLQVRDRERALDLVQETMLAACQGLHRFEGRSRFSSWLFAIARYRFLGCVRAPRLLIDDAAELDEVASSAPTIEDEYVRREQEKRLIAVIDQVLEPVEHLALWLRCVECKTVDEITRLLELESKSGARGLLQTARRKLRARFESESDFQAHV